MCFIVFVLVSAIADVVVGFKGPISHAFFVIELQLSQNGVAISSRCVKGNIALFN